jgi:photosystem II stability/assembly factor-like uncharacterized protein
MLRALCCILISSALCAQEPFRVSYGCAEAELQNAGLLCTEDEPCPIFFEINAIASVGKKIVLAGDIHATAATLASVLLTSDNGGAAWKEPVPRIPGASLDQLQVVTPDRAWAAGETQFPLLRDPFFVLTTDAGDTWRKRNLSEEGDPGSILTFGFDSPQHGELIVDGGKSAPGGRYLYYESETGAESWTIRSTTDALPKLKHMPSPADNTDLRVRPAEGGKNYEIERRLAGNWQPIASLAIEIASCKLKPTEQKEPPPVTDEPAPKDYVEELKLGAPNPPAASPKAPQSAPAKKGPAN